MLFHDMQTRLGAILARVLPRQMARTLITKIADRDPDEILEAFGPRLNRAADLDRVSFDLDTSDILQFEELAGLFSSTSLDHGAIAMPVRQAAYIFGLIRRMRPERVVEIGRYKGGSTLLMAAAMAGVGRLWSIDIGEKESRLQTGGRPYDKQLLDMCSRLGLSPTLLIGDSRTIEVDTGFVDLVVIDGDHSYDGVRSDFERFGRRVRVGGALLLDDARTDGVFSTHSDSVGRLVDEVVSIEPFRLIKSVNRLVHLERVAS